MTRARFPDPYEGMSDEELDRRFSELISENRERQRSISIRFPDALLEELRRLADQLGIRYQTLIKRLLEQDVARLRTRGSSASDGRTRAAAKRSATSTARSHAAPRAGTASVQSAPKKRATRHPRVSIKQNPHS